MSDSPSLHLGAHPARPSGADVALRAVDVVKTYPAGRGAPAIRALDGLDLTVRAGEVFGLLGPNGAGKSTTVKILSTLSRADSGQASVAGHDVARDPQAVRRVIGLVPQKTSAAPLMTGRESIVLAGRIYGQSSRRASARAAELLDRFDLSQAADRLTRTYSGGMARKLDIAIGLVNRPSVLFLDEPTTGLDPESRSELWAEIARLAGGDGMTVLLTTHYLEEADHLADRLAIIDGGRVVVEGSPDELKSDLRGDGVAVELAEAGDGPAASRVLARALHAPRRDPAGQDPAGAGRHRGPRDPRRARSARIRGRGRRRGHRHQTIARRRVPAPCRAHA